MCETAISLALGQQPSSWSEEDWTNQNFKMPEMIKDLETVEVKNTRWTADFILIQETVERRSADIIRLENRCNDETEDHNVVMSDLSDEYVMRFQMYL